MLHDDVAEAAVIGRPSKEYGEEIAAFIVSATTAGAPDTNTLRSHCTQNLAPYKVPREFYIVDELPKSGVGKVLKTELRARLGAD